MSTSEERYISPRRLNDFKTLLESEYKIDKHSDQIQSLLNRGAKNLLKITATSQTINGVTFTVNEDQTVTVNGTNTGTGGTIFIIVPTQQAILIPDGDYQFLGCPHGGGSNTFDLRWFHYSPNASAYDTGSGAVIHKSGNTTDANIAIVVKSGVTVNNVTFKPMLCTVEDYAISQEYVPYAPTNRELYDMILSVQSGIITIDKEETYYDSTQSSLKFRFNMDAVVPDFQLRQVGLIATSNAEIKYQLTLDTVAEAGVTFVKISDIASAMSNTSYIWTKTAVSAGNTWYVVPFMKYDNGDDIYLKYGHLYSITVNDGGTLTIIRICKE